MTNIRDGNKTACREVKTQGLRGVAGVNRLQTIAGIYHVTENRRELAITSQTHMYYVSTGRGRANLNACDRHALSCPTSSVTILLSENESYYSVFRPQ